MFTVQGTAHVAHIKGKEIAQSVVVHIDGKMCKMCLCVLPARLRLGLRKLKRALEASEVTPADESEFADRFPGCEVGVMPRFGNPFARFG